MGYYLQTPENLNKAQQLVELYGASPIEPPKTFDPPKDKFLICVVCNGPFDAAAVCYDTREFNEFSSLDSRPRSWLLMDRIKVIELIPSIKDQLS
jgi:hypothetical protein